MRTDLKLFAFVAVILIAPIQTAWKLTTGTYYGSIQTDVLSVTYDSNYVYVRTNSVPSYSIGPWTGDPNVPSAQNKYYSFKLTTTIPSTKTALSTGAIGLWKDGVEIFNGFDAVTYNTYWHRNAYYWEGSSFDSCLGHPDVSGTYHNHINPICLYTISSTSHSPLIGFMFDSFPIYGPYGYASANDSSSAIKLMTPSFAKRNITERTTLPTYCYPTSGASCGSTLGSSYYGPSISTSYPIGAYLEDYDYYAGSGDLDQYNGRWCVTPEYPSGTYAYFVTRNSSGYPLFPFVIGYYFYGSSSDSSLTTAYLPILVLTQISVTLRFFK